MKDATKEDFAAMVQSAERIARPWRHIAIVNGLVCVAVLSFVFLRKKHQNR